MFKRVAYLLLSLAFVLTFVACGGKKEEEEEEEAPKGAATTAANAPPAASAAPAAAPAAGGATITGKVAFTGTAPAKEQIKMDADAYCKGAHAAPVYTQDVVVNPNGTLQWVLVYVKEGATGNYPPPAAPVTLDQRGCQYHPHTFGIQAGQPLKIVNSDGTLHNIHALPKINAEFNIGQPFQKMETLKKFDKAEMPVRFKCDVHKWMGAYCGVFNHPKYGAQTQNVTVAGSETKTIDFSFKG